MKKEPDSLTRLMLHWRKTGNGYEELLRESSNIVIEYPRRHKKWEKDQCSEFYLFFYDRLIKLINDFEYRGISFYAILNNTIAWQINSFYRHGRSSRRMKYCLHYNAIIEAEEAADSVDGIRLELTDTARDILNINNSGRITNHRLCRQLLMLVFKNALFLDEPYISKIVEVTGCDRSLLVNSIMILRRKCEGRKRRMEIYKERANKAYMELCQIHRELSICENATERYALIKRIDCLKKRLNTACSRKNSVLMCPTNAEVAEVMNLPKGTIDSGLHHMKKILRALVEQDDALNRIVQ